MSDIAVHSGAATTGERIFGRSWSALVRKDCMILAGKRSIWAFQTLLLAYLCIALFVSLLGSGDRALTGEVLRDVAERMTLTASVATFLAALFVTPMLTVSALSEEVEGGMLEVLQATPLSHRQLFTAIVSARLLLLWLLLFATVPLVAFPIILGAPVPWGIILRGVPCILLATTVTMLFSIRRAASGDSRLTTYWRLLTLILWTPAAWGIATLFKIVFVGAAIILLFSFSGNLTAAYIARESVFGAAFPFWGIGHLLFEGWDDRPFYIAGSLLSLGGGLLLTYGAARGSFRRWMTRNAEGHTSRQLRRKSRPSWERRKRSLRRLLGDQEMGEIEGESDYKVPPRGALLLSTRRLSRPGTAGQMAYRASGRNPFVVKELLSDARGPSLMWGAGGLILLTSKGASGIPSLLAVYLTAIIAAIPLSQLFTSDPRGGADDVLKSTPINLPAVIAGAFGVVFLRTWFVAAILAMVHVVDWVYTRELGLALLSYLNYVLIVLLVVAIGLWCNLLLRSIGQRIASILAVVALASLSIFILPPHLPHPLAIWTREDVRSGTEFLFAGGALLATAMIVLTGFAVAYRRWWRHS